MEDVVKAGAKLSRDRHKLSLKEKMSYGYGEVASAFVWGMVTSYLLYFYTDVYGISASAAGTLFLVTRLWDAANDPIMGVIVDRTKTKHGKTRPYLLYLAIPLGIISVLTFITPDFSDTGKLVYAYVTYLLLGMVYTAINLPYGALAPTMTRNSKEKVDLGSYRAMGLAIGTVIVSAATLPLVNFFGKGNEQVGFPITITLYSIIAAILFFLTFKNCKERYSEYVESKDRKKVSVSLKEMFKNLPWVLVAITSFLKFLRLGAMNAVLIYYVTYVLGEPGMVPVYLTLLNGATFAGGALAMPLLKKIGNKLGTQSAIAIGSIFFILLFFIQADSPILFAVIFFLANMFVGVDNASVFVLLGDSIDYHEWKFGQRLEGLLYSAYSFSTKFGVAIGSVLVAYALGFVNYDPTAITGEVKNMISGLMFIAPIVFSVLQVITLAFYKLDKYHASIVEELNNK